MLIVFLMGLNAYLISKTKYGELSPSFIINILWAFYCFIPIILNPSVEVNPISLLIIYVSLGFFSISHLLFPVVSSSSLTSPKSFLFFKERLFFRLIIFFCISSILFNLVSISLQGMQIIDLLFNPLKFANSVLALRYRGDFEFNIFGSLSTILTYTNSILVGIFIGVFSKKKTFTVFCLGLLPAIFILITTAAKGQVFLSLFYILGGVISAKLFTGQKKLITKRFKSNLKKLSVVLTILVVFGLISRDPSSYENNDIDSVTSSIFKGVNSYASGHILCFSDWINGYYFNMSENEYYDSYYKFIPGFMTFTSLYDMLGYNKSLPRGVYVEFLENDSFKSNIYTVFRGLIYDFGLFGNFLFWIILGMISHFIFLTLVSKKNNIFVLSIFPVIIGWIYQSYIISNFMWNTTFLSGVIVYVILKTSSIKVK